MHEGVCWILGLCVAVCVSPLPSTFITSRVCVSLLQQQQKQQQTPPFAKPSCCEHGSAPRGEHPGAGPSFKAEPPSPDPRGCWAPFKRINAEPLTGKQTARFCSARRTTPRCDNLLCSSRSDVFSGRTAAPISRRQTNNFLQKRKKQQKLRGTFDAI